MLSSCWSIVVENKEINTPRTSFSTTTANANIWLNTLQVIYQFSSISDFWCFHDNTTVPSNFPPSIKSIRVFKTGSSLAREGNDNIWGGRISIDFLNGGNSDKCWLNLLLFALSDEYSEFSSLINGLVAAAKFHRKNIPLPTLNKEKQVSSLSKSRNTQNNSVKNEIPIAMQGKICVRLEIWLNSNVKDCGEIFIARFIDCLYGYFGDDLLKGRCNDGTEDDAIVYQSHL
jgi:hypothetical protein